MPKSLYLDNIIINQTLRGVPYTPPAVVYAAIYTVAPTPSSPGVEVSGGGYTRQTATFGVPVNGTAVNASEIVFPIALAPWGTIVAVGLMDSPVAGNLLYFSPLTAPRDILVDDQFRLPVGQLSAQET